MWLKLAILLVVVYLVYTKFFKPSSPTVEAKAEPKKPKRPFWEKKRETKADEETMVECAQCGTYVSSSEAFIKGSRFYCSPECLKEAS